MIVSNSVDKPLRSDGSANGVLQKEAVVRPDSRSTRLTVESRVSVEREIMQVEQPIIDTPRLIPSLVIALRGKSD